MNHKRFYDPSAPVQPEQLDGEFRALLAIVNGLAPGAVVEIGSYKGGSLYQWQEHTAPGSVIIAIDLPGGPWGSRDALPHVGQWREWGPEIIPILADSHSADTVEAVRQEIDAIDFLFIDGDHRYEGAKSDFDLYWPMVRPGGIVALHDVLKTDEGCGVAQFWCEIQASGLSACTLMSYPDQSNMGIGVIFKPF